MIKKSILLFFILLGIHALIVWAYPSIGMATNQWQDNLVKAQTFLYAEKADTAMVGTSLSARIIRDSIPMVKSVSFGGCSVEDGLRIISHKKPLPDYVLVETNLIFQEGNKELVSRLTEGTMPVIRERIPSLREQYEPICLVASLLMKASHINPQAGMAIVDTLLLNESIKHKIAEDKIRDDATIAERLSAVRTLTSRLESQGVKFVFFEMPVNEKLIHLKEYEQTRKVVKEAFPPNKYHYLPTDTTKYLTTDGIHLDYEGQQIFSHWFKRILSQF